MIIWGVSGNSKRVQSVVDLWLTGDATEQSFVRRQSTEPFSLVFGDGCLLPPSLYYGNDLICGFVPSSDCRKWLPVGIWHKRKWVFLVPSLLSDSGGDLTVSNRTDGIELYYPSSTVLRTTWILHCKWQSYFLASCRGCQWDWWHSLLGLRVWNRPGALSQRGAKWKARVVRSWGLPVIVQLQTNLALHWRGRLLQNWFFLY